MTSPRTTRKARSGGLVLAIAPFRWLFLILGMAALGYCAYAIVTAHNFQAGERQQFESRTLPLSPEMPFSGQPVLYAGGSVIGELEIPRLQVKDVFIEGVTAGDLRKAVGHIPGTAFPWQNGNVVLSGHRDTFFRPLRNIRAGDLIVLHTMYGSYRYRVLFTQIVKPTDVQVLAPHTYRGLTLTTCYPFYYVGPAPDRFIVVAALENPLNSRA